MNYAVQEIGNATLVITTRECPRAKDDVVNVKSRNESDNVAFFLKRARLFWDAVYNSYSVNLYIENGI